MYIYTSMTSHDSYEERMLQGLRLLNTIYDKVNGIADENAFVYSHLLAHDLGMSHSTALYLARYLQGKNLLKISMQVSGQEYRVIWMTEKGITEIERARANQETPVEKYPPGAISLAIHGNVTDSPIIQSGSNISNVEVNVSTVGDDLEKIKKFVDLLKAEYLQYNLTSEQKSEIEADIKSIESQLTSPKPKIDILKQIGRNAWEVVKPLASEALKECVKLLFTHHYVKRYCLCGEERGTTLDEV